MIDTVLAVLALSPFLLAILVQVRYAGRTRSATADAEQRRGEVAAVAADNIHEAKLMMSLGRTVEQRSSFDRAVETLFAG